MPAPPYEPQRGAQGDSASRALEEGRRAGWPGLITESYLRTGGGSSAPPLSGLTKELGFPATRR